MRKFWAKIVTILLVAVLGVSTLTGCDLITTNTERDMAQIVAKVQISEDVTADEIKKSEMLSAYMSYGYQYVAYYGYTVSDTYQMILDNLVQNRIIIQHARVELAKLYNGMVDDASKASTDFLKYYLDNVSLADGETKLSANGNEKDDLKKFLSEYELAFAEYNVLANINAVIDSYVEEDEEDEEERENTTYTARATPAEEEKDDLLEYELKTDVPSDYDYKVANVTLKNADGWEAVKAAYANTYDLNMAVYKAYTVDLSNADRVKALNKAVKDLKKAGLVKEDESYDVKDIQSVLDLTYFKNNLVNQYESAIVAKFEDSLLDDVRARLTADVLWAQYAAEYNTQDANYKNDYTAYETALEAVNDDVFVVCNPYSGYGYVANLLIGFSDEQKAILSAYSSKAGVTDAQIDAKRDELLAQLMVKDQRETWVYSSYGSYNEESDKFAFDKKYMLSEEGSAAYNALNSFIGKVYGASSYEKENDDKVMETVWTFDNVVAESMTFDSFVSTYLNPLTGLTKSVYDGTDATVAQIADVDAIRNAYEDLLYAFSTDAGSLGKHFGYLYSPITSSTKYVEEFADASAKVVAKGEGAYTIVATEYGYHVILCTEKVEADPYTMESEAQFKADINNKNTDSVAYKYMEIKFNHVSTEEVGKLASNFINGYLETAVKYFEKTYSDLIEETDSSAK